MFSPEIKCMILFREIQFEKNKFIKVFKKQRLRRSYCKIFTQISIETKIEKVFYIGILAENNN